MLSNTLRTLLISLSLFFFSFSTHAQEGLPPLDLTLQDPSLLLLNPDNDNTRLSKTDMIDAYYKYCVQSNLDPALNDYMPLQCGCTAAEMDKIMDENDLYTMYKDTERADFEYARMMVLAYIPCMKNSVKKYVFDNCVFDGHEAKKTRRDIRFCQCQSDYMGDYVAQYGDRFIPGFYRGRFTKAESVANPLEAVLLHKTYQKQYNHRVDVCMIDSRT